jgi:hypothetical protein
LTITVERRDDGRWHVIVIHANGLRSRVARHRTKFQALEHAAKLDAKFAVTS